MIYSLPFVGAMGPTNDNTPILECKTLGTIPLINLEGGLHTHEPALPHSARNISELGYLSHCLMIILENGSPIGAGSIIGPHLALTAKHLVGNKASEFKAIIGGETFDLHTLWESEGDLALVLVSSAKQREWPRFRLSMHPLRKSDAIFNCAFFEKEKLFEWVYSQGHITDILQQGRRVLVNFPSIICQMAFAPGHSGSPIFDEEGSMIAVVSRGGIQEFGSLLWPLLSAEIKTPLFPPVSFIELLQSRIVEVVGWRDHALYSDMAWAPEQVVVSPDGSISKKFSARAR